MMKKFDSLEDMKKHFGKSQFETDTLIKVENDFKRLWAKLNDKKLFLKLNKTTGHKAYCMLRDSYSLTENATNLMSLFELFYHKEIDLSKLRIKKEDVILLVCMAYNLYLEKISDFFTIILDIPKLCKMKKPFYHALDIVKALEKQLPNYEIFKYAHRDLRNALAHYDFKIYEDHLVYNSEKKYKQKYNQVVLSLEELLQASLSLNRSMIFIFKKIEKYLEPYLDENRLKRESKLLKLKKKRIINEQKRGIFRL